jgi:hypothetical protein
MKLLTGTTRPTPTRPKLQPSHIEKKDCIILPLLPARLGLRQGQAGASREAALKRTQSLFRLIFVQTLQFLGGRTARAVSGLV